MPEERAQTGDPVPLSVYNAAKTDLHTFKGKYRAEKALHIDTAAKLATATASIATLTTERDTLQNAPKPAPDEKDLKIAELTGTIRTRSHKDAMGELLKDSGIRPDALEALLTLSKYNPEQFETAEKLPDTTKIKTFLATAAKAHTWSVAAAAPAATAADAASALSLTGGKIAGPGVNRGSAPLSPPSDPRIAAAEALKATTGKDDAFRIA